ncbi:MAG: DUF6600 domain-containing protein [Terriglobia bacterium]
MKPHRVDKVFWRAAVMLMACLCGAQLIIAQGAQDQNDQGDPPARVARVSYVAGKVSLQQAGVDQWSEASLNYPMTTNDRLYTDQGARAELEVGSAAVRLSEATDLTIANLNDQFMQLGLAQGAIRVSVYELPQGNSVEVDTPNGALTLLRTGYYRVDTFPNDNATLVSVYSGDVQLSGGGLSQTLHSGQAVKLTGSGPIQVNYTSLPSQDSFDQWSAARDRTFVSAASARYVSRDTPGYASLDGYGVWSEAPQYGPIWYPTAVPAGWVPYRTGHWVWVGPWGWTWVDAEPWGFAPFHYGRWAFVGARWGWIPGPLGPRPYYAPALVAFVGGPHFSIGVSVGGGVGFAGWFPLGPREPYYPWYHSGNGYLRQVNVTNIRNVTNINNIVNVRNVNNIRYVNQRVATTVVRSNVFASGAPVRSGLVRMDSQQLAEARVIPHPMINPSGAATFGGRAVPAPIHTERFAATQANRRFATASPANPRGAPPTAANRTFERPQSARSYPPTTRPRLFTNRQPAPASVPFAAKERAMQTHPGRPLEPEQVNNLRQGRPAGPMRDREYISHTPRSQAPRSQGHSESKPKRDSGDKRR